MAVRGYDFDIGHCGFVGVTFLRLLFGNGDSFCLASNKLKLEIEKSRSPLFSYIAGLFSRHSGQYITTILVGNNIALVIYSLQMSILIHLLLDLFGWHVSSGGSFLIETVLPTIIIIFVAEYIPKAVVRINPNFYYRSFAVPVFLFYLLFYPLARITTFISTLILRIFGLPVNTRQGTQTFDRLDLAHLIDEASESDEPSDQDKDMKLFQNALDFSDLLVRDCMVPRVDIEAIERTESIKTLTERFIDTHFSRLPVYEESIDHIVGYVNTKSLFKQPTSIDEILQKIDYVPESMPAQKLLTLFIRSRHSIAVVIDEFGGTAGMVTIEDILEEIFGEIEDEHDSQDLVEKKMSDNEYLFSGRLEIEYVNEKYRLRKRKLRHAGRIRDRQVSGHSLGRRNDSLGQQTDQDSANERLAYRADAGNDRLSLPRPLSGRRREECEPSGEYPRNERTAAGGMRRHGRRPGGPFSEPIKSKLSAAHEKRFL